MGVASATQCEPIPSTLCGILAPHWKPNVEAMSTLRTAKKQRGRPFRKGQSGNPGGRPAKTPDLLEVERLAREASPAAIQRLVFWMNSTDPSASVKACNAILDRAFGKPAQAVEHTGHVMHDLSDFTDAELAAIIAGDDGSRRTH